MAKVSCILVSTWLTVPYFFVVSMGALQAIPEELTEAARVDGGSPFQIFRRVTLPLLLVAVGPLLIASFAFNFNNFNNIYLLTGGGPTSRARTSPARPTSSSATRTRPPSSRGTATTTASPRRCTIVIFLITAVISAFGFSKTAVLEEVA